METCFMLKLWRPKIALKQRERVVSFAWVNCQQISSQEKIDLDERSMWTHND